MGHTYRGWALPMRPHWRARSDSGTIRQAELAAKNKQGRKATDSAESSVFFGAIGKIRQSGIQDTTAELHQEAIVAHLDHLAGNQGSEHQKTIFAAARELASNERNDKEAQKLVYNLTLELAGWGKTQGNAQVEYRKGQDFYLEHLAKALKAVELAK
jgi:hypothetical protein